MKTQQGFAHAFIFVGIIAILVGALSVVFWKSIGSAANADPSNWKTYESEELPITFKYPSGWTEVKQTKSNYIRLFGGSTNSVGGYSLGIFYGKDMATALPIQTECSENANEMKSCEEFKTDIMNGLIVAPKNEGSDYEFNANIGGDRYTFNTNNGYLDISAFKKLLSSVKLK